MIELTKARSAQLAISAGRRERVIVGVAVAHLLDVAVMMPRKHGVLAPLEQLLDLRPETLFILTEIPQGRVREDERPARVRVLLQFFGQPVDLRLGHDVRLVAVIGIQHNEQHVVVNERVVARAETLSPYLGHDGIGVVVVARDVKERHL